MEKLRILLKDGEVKKFPWGNIDFKITDEHITVWEHTSNGDIFLFKTLMSNVEYAERIIDESE